MTRTRLVLYLLLIPTAGVIGLLQLIVILGAIVWCAPLSRERRNKENNALALLGFESALRLGDDEAKAASGDSGAPARPYSEDGVFWPDNSLATLLTVRKLVGQRHFVHQLARLRLFVD